MWCRDHGRAGVECEAVAMEDPGAAAWLIESLQHGHPPTGGAQSHRGREPSKAGPDHDRLSSSVCVHIEQKLDKKCMTVKIMSNYVAQSSHRYRRRCVGRALDREGQAPVSYT